METLKVLVVDEAEELPFMLGSVLEFNHFKVTISHKHKEAISQLAKEPFDLLITDFTLDGMNGFELIRKVRHELKNEKIRIILMTFKELQDKELRELSNENVTYVRKPFLPNDLVFKIENMFV